MPEITELLDRTTPHGLAPLDVEFLARSGRRRRRRQRAALTGTMVVVLVMAMASAALLLRPVDDVSTDGDIDTTVPVGTWSEAAPPPFTPRSDAFGGTLSDGRVLVWSGSSEITEGNELRGRDDDGGIYDPESDTWEPIPPLPAPQDIESSVRLAEDRLAVLPVTNDLAIDRVWIYDVAEGTWSSSPQLAVGDDGEVTMVWDGELLVVFTSEDPGATAPGANSTQSTLRWRYGTGQDDWETGATSPLSPRRGEGIAVDGSQVAVWGGSKAPLPDAPVGEENLGELLADGAVYDVHADEWQPLPPAPVSGRWGPAVMWSDGRLLVGGGQPGTDGDGLVTTDALDDLAAYDPASSTWEMVPPPPDTADRPTDEGPFYLEWGPFLQSGDWFLTADGWEPTTLQVLHEMDSGVVASSIGFEPGRAGDFPVEVWTGDEWLPAAEAPFGGPRHWGTVVLSGTKLVVVGGHEGTRDAPLNLVADTWVLDLAQDSQD